ncbi:hypothetical protein M153_8510002738 [Pseudoloma neurophilia]|uniref:Uncharacterized protein n=1 Tax=Pseudoloma neurophilia TaxID=146866 RepID=A0A0R0LVR2_9MICR|nr:hypothetical protein M153_8510002738 [Pseudoloma neurophilia]
MAHVKNMIIPQKNEPLQDCRSNTVQNATCSFNCGQKEKSLECECCWKKNDQIKCSNETINPAFIEEKMKDHKNIYYRDRLMFDFCPTDDYYISNYECEVKNEKDGKNGTAVCTSYLNPNNSAGYEGYPFDSQIMFDFFNTQPEDANLSKNITKTVQKIIHNPINSKSSRYSESKQEKNLNTPQQADNVGAVSNARPLIQDSTGDSNYLPIAIAGLSIFGLVIVLAIFVWKYFKRTKKHEKVDDLEEEVVLLATKPKRRRQYVKSKYSYN